MPPRKITNNHTKKNILNQKKQVDSSMSLLEPSKTGKREVRSKQSERKETEEDSFSRVSSHLSQKKNKKPIKIQTKEESATVESLLHRRERIWKDKLSSLDSDILLTRLSKISDQASISKEKDLIPFWTPLYEEISKRLWLPTRIDYVDSVLSSSRDSSPTPKGKSWFSIVRKRPQKKSLSPTSSQSSPFSQRDYTDSGVIHSKTKSERKPSNPILSSKKNQNQKLKTLKFRLFPTDEEKEQLQDSFNKFRWYYNSILNVTYNHYGYENISDPKKYSSYTIRDIFRTYEYTETILGNLSIQEFVRDESKNEFPIPPWWKNVNTRIIRGAINKFVSSLNSAISNRKAGNTKGFMMKCMSKKKDDYLHFEDKGFPVFIRKIKSVYWYRDKNGRRKISYSELCSNRGVEIIYEKETDRYFLHCPIECDWFPTDDKRNEKQASLSLKGNRIISLDPGVRKFLVGYDPSGSITIIGEGASKKLSSLLLEIDKIPIENKREKYVAWKRIRNLVSELHWKTISFLIENYDTIILPDFRISDMVKGKKLARIVKRLLYMFSFHSFKEKLMFKCNQYGKNLLIVDESFTSCTCGRCGKIKRLKGVEIYKCDHCGLILDRDVMGSRNIFLKNIGLIKDLKPTLGLNSEFSEF